MCLRNLEEPIKDEATLRATPVKRCCFIYARLESGSRLKTWPASAGRLHPMQHKHFLLSQLLVIRHSDILITSQERNCSTSDTWQLPPLALIYLLEIRLLKWKEPFLFVCLFVKLQNRLRAMNTNVCQLILLWGSFNKWQQINERISYGILSRRDLLSRVAAACSRGSEWSRLYVWSLIVSSLTERHLWQCHLEQSHHRQYHLGQWRIWT